MKTIIQKYKVVQKKEEAPQVTTLKLTPVDGTEFSFVPGQFITVYFPYSGTPEGKSYSISSAPHERGFFITVKAMGEFSNRLCGLRVGDEINGSLPYGFFYSENSGSDLVLLAAGIGIAPFRSIILANSNRKIILHHSSRTRVEAIFKGEFSKLISENFNVTHYFTREGSSRMNPAKIISTLPELKSPEFFICGSIEFVRDMWKGLKENGVPEDAIFTEAFFSH
jgi:ferredoxin-NADP reductase